MDDTSNRGRVAVCSVSRSSGAKWGVQNRCDGLSTCLTTNNSDLYAFSLGEGHANPALSLDRYPDRKRTLLAAGISAADCADGAGLAGKAHCPRIGECHGGAGDWGSDDQHLAQPRPSWL